MGLSSVTTRIALWDQVRFELRKNVSQKDVGQCVHQTKRGPYRGLCPPNGSQTMQRASKTSAPKTNIGLYSERHHPLDTDDAPVLHA